MNKDSITLLFYKLFCWRFTFLFTIYFVLYSLHEFLSLKINMYCYLIFNFWCHRELKQFLPFSKCTDSFPSVFVHYSSHNLGTVASLFFFFIIFKKGTQQFPIMLRQGMKKFSKSHLRNIFMTTLIFKIIQALFCLIPSMTCIFYSQNKVKQRLMERNLAGYGKKKQEKVTKAYLWK